MQDGLLSIGDSTDRLSFGSVERMREEPQDCSLGNWEVQW